MPKLTFALISCQIAFVRENIALTLYCGIYPFLLIPATDNYTLLQGIFSVSNIRIGKELVGSFGVAYQLNLAAGSKFSNALTPQSLMRFTPRCRQLEQKKYTTQLASAGHVSVWLC